MPKLLGVKRKDYDGGYTVWTFESENGTSHAVQRDCGDYYEVTPLKSLVFDKPLIVGATGDIPDEVKSEFKDGVPFKVPVTTLKFPKLPGDPTERDKVWDEVHAEGLKKMKSDYKQAYDKAMTSAKQEVAVLAIRDVNLDTNTSSGELIKDSSMVEKGIGTSSDELMKDNSVVEKGIGTSSDELMKDKDNSVVEKGTGSSSDELLKDNSVVEKGSGSSSD